MPRIPVHIRCHRAVLRASKYGEHMGFVGLAGAEVFHTVTILWHINVVLFVTGIGAIIYEKINDE